MARRQSYFADHMLIGRSFSMYDLGYPRKPCKYSSKLAEEMIGKMTLQYEGNNLGE